MTELSAATFHRVIGIDLGTTSCAVSAWDGSKLVVIPSASGSSTVPSVVGQDQAGQVVVGRLAAADQAKAVTGVKRLLGSGEPIRFRGRTYLPREICAFLLLELKRQAETYVGDSIHDAVITVPASAGEAQRRALREAAGLAGLNVRRLLDEPVAAAVAFSSDDRPRTYAIYDLGGGTFDASIVRIGPGTVAMLGTAGDPRLGGDDFDEHIVEYVLRQIRERHHVDLGMDVSIRQRIRREAERRKRELDTVESTTLELKLITATVSASIPLTRRGFEAMIEPDVQRSLDYLSLAIAEAEVDRGVGRADVDQVLLAGGSTRIPSIRTRLADYFGFQPADIRADVDPDELIVRGAGLVAREYEPSMTVEGSATGQISANLRLRAEMADPVPEPVGPPPVARLRPGVLTTPPAETPADFRAVADASHALLRSAPARQHRALRAAYTAFVAAVLAADPDVRLAELGGVLADEHAKAAG
ncbi:MAG: Hsp70 family protein [Actinoplanes sp.]